MESGEIGNLVDRLTTSLTRKGELEKANSFLKSKLKHQILETEKAASNIQSQTHSLEEEIEYLRAILQLQRPLLRLDEQPKPRVVVPPTPRPRTPDSVAATAPPESQSESTLLRRWPESLQAGRVKTTKSGRVLAEPRPLSSYKPPNLLDAPPVKPYDFSLSEFMAQHTSRK